METDFFHLDENQEAAKKKFGLQGKFVVSYIGTLGLAHGLKTVLEAAAQLKDSMPDMLFLFVGEGADKERLESIAKEKGLMNILFLTQQPRTKIPAIIRASDICLVLLKKADVFKTVIPTKMLEFMSCGRPVILGVDWQARKVLNEAGGGVFIEPENSAALLREIKRLYENSELRDTLGQNGRNYIVKNLSRAYTAKIYTEILEKIVEK